MSTDHADIEVRGGPVGYCPECRSDHLLAVTNDWETNFFCEECHSCWHYSFGRVTRVDPLSCSGCRHEAACRRRLEDEMAATDLDLRNDDDPPGRGAPVPSIIGVGS